MNRFTGTATPLTAQGIEACAARLSVQPAEIWTVLRVETRGCGYFSDRRPVILFERHVFSRKTGHRFDAQAPDISNPQAGGYAGGVKEYERLARALALDEQAALESASWGLGQVMGFNATDLGYGSVEQFVTRMMVSEDEQLAALTTFIQKNGLAEPLRHHDWAAFARGYNGPGYEKNQYDKKLAEAYQHLTSRSLPDLSVREGQLLLTYLGFEPGSVDGASGPHTLAALHKFQSQSALPTTSSFDAATLEALRQRHQALPVTTPAVTAVPAPQPVAVPAPLVTLPVSLPVSAPATPSVLVSVPSAPVMAVPVPAAAPVMEASPLPAQLAEQLGHRLSQPLNKGVQEELARLLALRPRVAEELGPSAVQTVDLGLTALMVE
ncbi:MAG TPA: N-acetylmuramidase domain-containing protein, partial [Archangium sp.]|nr:N-acetylmuramidase domain-containing protein [Archangium sp.]